MPRMGYWAGVFEAGAKLADDAIHQAQHFSLDRCTLPAGSSADTLLAPPRCFHMETSTEHPTQQGWLSSFGVAVPMILFPIVVLTFPVTASAPLGLSRGELSSWIVALWALPAALGIILSWRYQQPLFFTGNIFMMIFIVSLKGQYRFSELAGSAIVAGLAVALVSALGFMNMLSRLIPPPIVMGLLAGAALPFVIDVFNYFDQEPVMIGLTLLAFIVGPRIPGGRIPPILPALVVGTVLAFLLGKTGEIPERVPPPSLVFVTPTFSVNSLLATAPILVILLTLQSSLPSLVFLSTQGYDPPTKQVYVVGGLSSAFGSLVGPTGVSLSLPATSLTAGPQAGNKRYRHRAVYIANGFSIFLALISGIAADLTTVLPPALMLSVAGIASIAIVSHALQQAVRGPLVLGPIFAFACSLSGISLLGMGSFFWGLVIGTGVSMILERDDLRQIHASDKRTIQQHPGYQESAPPTASITSGVSADGS
jgi:benzoate membrane transport protein